MAGPLAVPIAARVLPVAGAAARGLIALGKKSGRYLKKKVTKKNTAKFIGGEVAYEAGVAGAEKYNAARPEEQGLKDHRRWSAEFDKRQERVFGSPSLLPLPSQKQRHRAARAHNRVKDLHRANT